VVPKTLPSTCLGSFFDLTWLCQAGLERLPKQALQTISKISLCHKGSAIVKFIFCRFPFLVVPRLAITIKKKKTPGKTLDVVSVVLDLSTVTY
jgi:hypothetical protein